MGSGKGGEGKGKCEVNEMKVKKKKNTSNCFRREETFDTYFFECRVTDHERHV